jgi:hypothetical protein
LQSAIPQQGLDICQPEDRRLARSAGEALQ